MKLTFDVMLNTPLVGEAAPVLNLVVLYEDLTSGMRVMGSLQKLTERLPFDATFKLKSYRFELLETPEGRANAHEIAAHADILLLGMPGDNELPKAVTEWLRDWLQRRDGRTCALGLVVSPENVLNPAVLDARQIIESIADEGRIDFIDSLVPETDGSPHQTQRMIPWRQVIHANQAVSERMGVRA